MAERNPVVDEWISKAEGDWRAMQLLHQQPGHEDAVVFHAQQCLEKYFKAALIAHGETVQKIHDLRELSRQLGILMPDWGGSFRSDPDHPGRGDVSLPGDGGPSRGRRQGRCHHPRREAVAFRVAGHPF